MTDSNYSELPGRRLFLQRAALIGTGMSAGLLAGCAGSSMAATSMNSMSGSDAMANDVTLLNVALGLEYQAIAAYQVGAESGLLEPGVKKVALAFQDHHKQHADALRGLIKNNDGTPVAEKAPLTAPIGKLAQAYDIPVSKIHNQGDVVHYAASLEQGAAKAYLGTIAKFHDRNIAHAAASIEGDETMHWAVLRNALGMDPVPVAFIA